MYLSIKSFCVNSLHTSKKAALPSAHSLATTFLITIFTCLSVLIQVSPVDASNRTEVAPLDLVSPKRADLMAKYIYAKHREWKTSCRFGTDIYHRHLGVWNGLWEYDPPKRSFEDFIISFNDLLDSIKQEGFNSSYPIPVGSDGIICNGAHRLSACLLYNKKVNVDPIPYECPYDFDYFKELGLESKYLDAMALQYCELKPDSYIMIVFPSAVGHKTEVEKIIKSYAEIVYKKEILFTPIGGFNLILTAYEHEPFVREGIGNNYPSARYKAKLCFPDHLTPHHAAKVYLLRSESLDLIKACKAKIRALFNIYNDSVHTTDIHREAIVLARTLFNKNSLHRLNHKKVVSFPQFERYFEEYRNWLASNHKENEWFSVDGGAILAAYGLRECNDLDFLHYEKEDLGVNIPGIDSHNHLLHHHALPLDDILFDPDNYFFYRGVKFCSLSILKRMKEQRGESKDFFDLWLISQLD